MASFLCLLSLLYARGETAENSNRFQLSSLSFIFVLSRTVWVKNSLLFASFLLIHVPDTFYLHKESSACIPIIFPSCRTLGYKICVSVSSSFLISQTMDNGFEFCPPFSGNVLAV